MTWPGEPQTPTSQVTKLRCLLSLGRKVLRAGTRHRDTGSRFYTEAGGVAARATGLGAQAAKGLRGERVSGLLPPPRRQPLGHRAWPEAGALPGPKMAAAPSAHACPPPPEGGPRARLTPLPAGFGGQCEVFLEEQMLLWLAERRGDRSRGGGLSTPVRKELERCPERHGAPQKVLASV